MKYQVGQKVQFRFGRIPSTEEGRAITAQRGHHAAMGGAKYDGPWTDMWVAATIEDVIETDDGIRYVVDGYRVKASELKPL